LMLSFHYWFLSLFHIAALRHFAIFISLLSHIFSFQPSCR
jgi:hypothetical protein